MNNHYRVMNTLGEKLKDVRGATARAAFAEMLGVHPNSLAMYERGERLPDIDFLALFASQTGTPFSELLSLRLQNGSNEAARTAGQSGDWSVPGLGEQAMDWSPVAEEPGEGLVFLPLYAARPSAGGGSLAQPDDVVDHLAFKGSWVHEELGRNARDLAVLRASGDSMSPHIQDGDLVVVDTADQELQNGRIYVLNIAGALVLKRLDFQPPATVRLCSDNPTFPAAELDADELQRLTIIGRAVWRGGRT
ncbi:XRE family transcriptional regulator [Ferruginivarius sediminum]|uniref:LexA family transcriptional regulator n=1 Tax=Ferruginivarius sediminum TaxID=2661937 RepID=A0A369TDZ1_9PROT|nr:XRE family transcriptional regulator [Ferruginivarius sediminum]RDD63490.1 LexA family transcriptional regulator [Ferruginivarius sediminum]